MEDEEGKLFGKFNSKDIRKKILKLINGGSGVKLKDFLPKEILVAHDGDDEYGDKKIDLSSETLEDDINGYGLPESYIEIILEAKKIYDFRTLAYLLHGESLLCDAMFHVYEEHKEQLAALKRLYKKFATKEQYYFMFRDSRILDGDDSDDKEDKEESNKEESKDKKKKASYVSYIGYTKTNSKAKYTGAHITSEKNISVLIKQIKNDLKFDDLKSKVDRYQDDPSQQNELSKQDISDI